MTNYKSEGIVGWKNWREREVHSSERWIHTNELLDSKVWLF